MILNLSPLAAHLGESLTSLRFATKVSTPEVLAPFSSSLPPFPPFVSCSFFRSRSDRAGDND
ncbi:hypothetical protein EDC04DRAFT_2761157 [Pisolithus marmoratus]|nr:hypothetical protein EDC04DRAFT_2830298 [Pisolithus marmoratus]KAI6012360.1 hypothetical protein EDC04DRAFT_2761157 [Pisolithus marmoratus]